MNKACSKKKKKLSKHLGCSHHKQNLLISLLLHCFDWDLIKLQCWSFSSLFFFWVADYTWFMILNEMFQNCLRYQNLNDVVLIEHCAIIGYNDGLVNPPKMWNSWYFVLMMEKICNWVFGSKENQRENE